MTGTPLRFSLRSLFRRSAPAATPHTVAPAACGLPDAPSPEPDAAPPPRLRRPGRTRRPGHLAPGRRIYAIGDVHGHADRLRALHALVASDLARRPAAESLLVQLGDLIDRGPDPAGAIEASLRPDCPVDQAVTLLGNHEAALLDALDGADPAAPGWWLAHGGDASLRSWGIPAHAPPAAWAGLIPPGHLRFLRSLPTWLQHDGYGFAHAGIRPGRRRQRRADLLWIREPFLSSAARARLVVVHGHTPTAGPCVHPHRIGVDTGVAEGGPLTCAVLEGSGVMFLSA